MDDTKSNRRGKRRTGIERRQYSYTHYFPERRTGEDRRQEDDNDQPSEGKK